MRNCNTLTKIITPILVGLSAIIVSCEKLNEKHVSKSNSQELTCDYYLEGNWSYRIDVERDGIKDVTIFDPYGKIKRITPVKGGCKIIFNANKKGKYRDKMFASFENEN